MSSPRREQQVCQHFTHVHPLTKIDGFGEFTCNGCNTYGLGTTYRCASCNYDLHEYCTKCPSTLLSFLHPQHELQLVFRGPEQMYHDKRICNICHELAEGLYYHCEACGFDMHPLCSQFPQQVSHVPHPAHPLELSHQGASNICMVCHGAIRSWRYKCDPCLLDVHMECVNSSASATRGIQQKGFGAQPYFQPSQYQQPQEPYFQYQPSYYQPCQYQQPFFQPSQYQQPYFQPFQYQQSHYHPYQYYQPNYNHHSDYTNQGQVQESGPGTGKKMWRILMTLTAGVACNIIAAPVCAAFF